MLASHPQVGQLLTPRRSSKAESGLDVTVMPLAMALGVGAAPILGCPRQPHGDEQQVARAGFVPERAFAAATAGPGRP